jgi:transcriptional regulator with XRE-family HTH domain
MRDVVDRLKKDFADPDYRHVYDEGFLNSSLATQIKVLREGRGWTQAALAETAGMNQSRISELEDVNFNTWTIRTLRKLARAFDLRLKISFEEFGTLLEDFRNLNRTGLSKRSFNADPAFQRSTTALEAKLTARHNLAHFAKLMAPTDHLGIAASFPLGGNENLGGAAQNMVLVSGNNSPGTMSGIPSLRYPTRSQGSVLREAAAEEATA